MEESSIPLRSPTTAYRIIENQAFIIFVEDALTRQAKTHVLNETATRIWELADGTQPESEMTRRLSEEFEVSAETARGEVVALLEDLSKRGLLIFSKGAPVAERSA